MVSAKRNRNRFALHLLLYAILIGCTHMPISKNASAACLDPRQENIHQLLRELDGQRVCIRGPLTLETHGPYFKTIFGEEENLYGGNIYIPLSFGDALRSGLKDNDIYKYEGVLRVEKNSRCSHNSCYVYYLDLPG